MTPFGQYLEALRRSRNLQQKQMADILGVNPSYISSLEKGRKKAPSHDVLKKMATQLKLSDAEVAALWRNVEISETTLYLPKEDMCTEEYEFVFELRKKLGSLSQGQLAIMRTTLGLIEPEGNNLR